MYRLPSNPQLVAIAAPPPTTYAYLAFITSRRRDHRGEKWTAGFLHWAGEGREDERKYWRVCQSSLTAKRAARSPPLWRVFAGRSPAGGRGEAI
ncbi:hypothetical protein E2C01_000369 [Portunus trituberculatus]|uniref:Uncharacterized protein n=1 Tax=Portunus trituberculatus TaxID=210409 RepID=A0A5B7CDW5_PORTR|nr:hypothetical protein [Portunus trituberculatus]